MPVILVKAGQNLRMTTSQRAEETAFTDYRLYTRHCARHKVYVLSNSIVFGGKQLHKKLQYKTVNAILEKYLS